MKITILLLPLTLPYFISFLFLFRTGRIPNQESRQVPKESQIQTEVEVHAQSGLKSRITSIK